MRGRIDRSHRRRRVAPAGRLLAALLAGLCAGGCFNRPLEEGDRQLLVTVVDLAGYGATIDPVDASIVERRVQYFDGSLELEYEFEAAESSASPLYLSAVAGLERRKSDALVTYTAQREAVKLTAKAGGLDMVPMPSFFSWGDDSLFVMLEYEGVTVGNFFLARKGRKTYFLMLSGFYFDEPALWAELVQPRLDRLSAFDP